ncbi:hypothetical protein BDV93DRAFT_87686 [Ceratobasidium sp. AG-I]|nr:hypothetical protein BDV93DRAFT_87686 [Ceratobasidium sp. AG-I]
MESELLPGGRGELRLTNHRPEIAFANLSSLLFYTGPYLKSSVIRDVHGSWSGLFLFRGLARHWSRSYRVLDSLVEGRCCEKEDERVPARRDS